MRKVRSQKKSAAKISWPLTRLVSRLAWVGLIALSLTVLASGAIALFLLLTPDGRDLKGCLKTTMFQVDLCPTKPGYVRLSQISPYVRNAIVASEDSAFWDHHGIDWVELQNSIETNLKKGRLARGGSTITQQLAKNVYLSSEKSFLRKVREAVIALRLERLYEKSFLLERYLNVVEFAPGIYGVRAAAQHYFHVDPAELNIGQSAWLAFLLPNPEKYSISFSRSKLTPFAAQELRRIVSRLQRFKKISEEERRIGFQQIAGLFGPGSATETAEEGVGLTLENSPEWDAQTADDSAHSSNSSPNSDLDPDADFESGPASDTKLEFDENP